MAATAAAAAVATATAVAVILCVGPTRALFRAAGPFNVEIRSLERCEDQGKNLLNFTTRLHKFSPTQYVYDGPWRWPYPVDNKWRVKLNAARWGTSGWGKNALSFDSKSPCEEALKLCNPMFVTAAEAGGFPASCPIPAGDYMLKNWIVNISLPFPMLFYGRYQVNIDFQYEGERIGCIRLYCDVVEKDAS